MTSDIPKSEKKRIIVHCASLGEYEQSRSLIEQLNKQGFEIILSFYSASGYKHAEANNTYQRVYLPFDLPEKMALFIRQTKPDLVIFVKYEFWFNFIVQLREAGIPFIFVSMYLTAKKKYFSWPYSSLFKSIASAEAFFVQDKGTSDALKSIHIDDEKIQVLGDNRIESILETQLNRKHIKACENLKAGLIVYASVYIDDIEMINKSIAAHEDKIHLIVPHNVDEATINKFSSGILDCQRFDHEKSIHPISVVDEIGLLKHLYHYAELAYIGGGFQGGIHNCLEALAYQCPIIIGPRNKGFKEIQELEHTGFIEIINHKRDLGPAVKQVLARDKNRNELKSYFEKNSNTSQQIVNYCIDLLNE